jgi:hypothetical protein
VEKTVHLLLAQKGQVLEGNFSYKVAIFRFLLIKCYQNEFSDYEITQQYGITPEMCTEMHVSSHTVCFSCTIQNKTGIA